MTLRYSMPLLVLTALMFLVPVVHGAPGTEDQSRSLEQILSKARAASGFCLGTGSSGLHLTGKANLLGADGAFVATYARDGRLSTSVTGELERFVTFDGRSAWEKEFSAGPYRLELFAREWAFLRAWVHSGYWLDSDAPVMIRSVDDSSVGPAVNIQLKDGALIATLELDPSTYLPLRLRIPNGSHALIVEYTDYARTGAVQVAGKVHTTMFEGHEIYWEVADVAEVATLERSAFVPPRPTLDTKFDSSVDSKVELICSRRKHLYVRPRINGEDVGLFLFDTGAGFTGISHSAAKKLGLAKIGSSSLTGLGGGVMTTSMSRINTFQLGPITIRNLVVSELGREGRDLVKGEEVAGVIGWDLLIRAVVDFRPRGGTLNISNPATYESKLTNWTPIKLHYQVPYVSVKFEGDREGLFMVDTGAAGSTLYFFSDVVRRLGLIKEKDGGAINIGHGAGGEFSRTLGPMAWMEIAGTRRSKDFIAIFGLGDDGEVDPYSLGLVGGGVLRLYRLVIDYSRYRISFQDE